jgi:hypothetical protein
MAVAEIGAGVILEVPDIERFHAFMASDDAARAMEENGLKGDTMHFE